MNPARLIRAWVGHKERLDQHRWAWIVPNETGTVALHRLLQWFSAVKGQAERRISVDDRPPERPRIGIARFIPDFAAFGICAVAVEVKVDRHGAAALRSLTLTIIYIRIVSR